MSFLQALDMPDRRLEARLPLAALVSLSKERAGRRKDPALPYVGLENLSTDTPRILSFAPSTASVSVNNVFRCGDILFGKLRPNLRKSAVANVDGYCSTDILVLRTNEGFAPSFAAHALRSDKVFRWAVRTAFGTKMPRTSWDALREQVVFVPVDIAEQRSIAEVLDAVDETIRSTEAVIAKLDHVKRGLLHDLLTRGIDDNGEIRDPERQPALFKESAIGRIPITWTTGSVLDVPPPDRQPILTGPFGAQLGARDFRPRGVPVLRIGNVQWGYVDHNELQFVSEAKASSLSRFRVRAGDLLFARQGATTGRNALADEECEGYLINYHIIRVAVDHERCRPVFLHAFINSASVSAQVERDKGRGTREGVNSRDIASFCIALPPVTEQDRIVNAIEAFEERLNLERAIAGKLAILRKGLADDLLSGRVRVRAEHQL